MATLFKSYKFRGKHATYVKFLCTEKGQYKENRAIIFERIIDAYMIGALIGFKYGKQAKINDSVADTSTISIEQMMGEEENLMYIYRLIMLCEKSSGLNEKERIERAFKSDLDEKKVEKNMQLFHSYVLGGIEYLYDTFKDCEDNEELKLQEMLNFVKMCEDD